MTNDRAATQPPSYTGARLVLRVLLTAFFVGAAIAHFRAPDILAQITPDWVPNKREVILTTGAFEGGAALALLLLPRWRVAAGIALALYTIAVWPANLKHALDGLAIAGFPTSWWYHGPRLALQPVIAWAALFAAGAVDWPFARRRAAPSA